MGYTVPELGSVVIQALRDADYRDSTIGQYKKTIALLTRYVDEHGGVYTTELGNAFASLTTSERTGRFSAQRRFDYSRLVHLFNTSLDTGAMPLTTRTRGGGGRYPVSPDLIAWWRSYAAHMRQRGLADTTIDDYGRAARAYLVYIEDQSVTMLATAGPNTVTGHFDALRQREADHVSTTCGQPHQRTSPKAVSTCAGAQPVPSGP